MSIADVERWRRVEATLTAALEVTTGQRTALLDRLCAGEDDLRREIDSLLHAHARSGQFLSSSAGAFAAPYVAELPDDSVTKDGAGSVVGRYRLIDEIGRGGMGTVWLAERADGHFEQRVALKLIKRGMDSDEILARFLRERQILARLEHPNIARLLDGGVSDDGRPYFVMEHVQGVPITRWCDERRRGRLRGFRVSISAPSRGVSYCTPNLPALRLLTRSDRFACFIRLARGRWVRCFERTIRRASGWWPSSCSSSTCRPSAGISSWPSSSASLPPI